MKHIALLAGLMMVGCGGGGGGGASGSPAVVIPPAVPTLTELRITPAMIDCDVDDVTVLSATGLYSDLTEKPLAVSWSATQSTAWTEFTTPPQVVSLGAANGVSTGITAVSAGTATIHATYGGVSANVNVTVHWDVPTNPKPFVGVASMGMNYLQQLLLYSGVPNEAPRVVADDPVLGGPQGVAINPAETRAYVLQGTTIYGIDLATGAIAADFAVPGGWGLDCDAEGFLYVNSAAGSIYRVDPSDGSVTTLTDDSLDWMGFTLGPDGAGYTVNIMNGQIVRHNFNGTSNYYAPCAGFDGNGAITFNRRNECFHTNLFDSPIYRYVDVNGDGDALGAGESYVFATTPFTTLFFSGAYAMPQGMIASGGRSVIVNVVGINEVPEMGLYRVTEGSVTKINNVWLDTWEMNMFAQTRK